MMNTEATGRFKLLICTSPDSVTSKSVWATPLTVMAVTEVAPKRRIVFKTPELIPAYPSFTMVLVRVLAEAVKVL